MAAATARLDAVATSAGRRRMPVSGVGVECVAKAVCGALGYAGVLTETVQAEVRAAPRNRCPLTLGEAGRVAAELGGVTTSSEGGDEWGARVGTASEGAVAKLCGASSSEAWWRRNRRDAG